MLNQSAPTLIFPNKFDQVQIASIRAPPKQVIRSAPEVTEKVEAPSAKVANVSGAFDIAAPNRA